VGRWIQLAIGSHRVLGQALRLYRPAPIDQVGQSGRARRHVICALQDPHAGIGQMRFDHGQSRPRLYWAQDGCGAREACRFETCLHSPDGPEKALTPRRLVGLGHYLAAIHEPDPGHAPSRRPAKQARVDLRAQTVRAQQLEVSGHFFRAARPEHSQLDARGLPTLNVSAHQF
jgi:hypothetical protein